MKYVAALMVVALAACSSSPAEIADARAPDSTVDATTGMPDPTLSSVITDRDTVIIGSTPASVYATLRDANGAPIVGASVQLVVASGSITSPAPTNSAGRTTAVWTNTVTGTYDVALVVDGVTVATHSVEFAPGVVAALEFDQQPTNVLAGAAMSPQVSVATMDEYGNHAPVDDGSVQLTLEPNSFSAGLDGNTSWSITAGTATFPELYVTTPGTGYRIRAHLAGLTDAVSAPFDVTMGGTDITRSSLAVTPSSLQADGVETSTIALHLANAYGVAIAGAGVSLAVTGTNNTIGATSGTTDANGDFTTTLSSTTAEAKSITAVAGGLTLAATVHFFGPSCTPRLPGAPGVPLQYQAAALVVDDLDGDSDADAVVVEGATPVLYRGRGDATFYPPAVMPTLTVPIERIKAADINGDGRLDLLMVVQNALYVAIELGSAGGQFATPTFAGTGAHAATRFATGDFDRDGKLDLAVALNDGSLEIVRNAGNGNFTTGQTIAGLNVYDLGAADLDGDGKLDLVITNANGVTSLLGHGDGTFAAPVASASTPVGNLVIADFNNDGTPDCAVANQGWTLQPYLGTGTGTFTKVGAAIPTAQYNSSTSGVAEIGGARDLDGDGRIDLVLGEGRSLTVLAGGGDGTFTLAHVYAPQALAVGIVDADDDGIADVITMGSQLLAVLHGRSDGSFVAPESHREPDDRGGMFRTSYDLDGNGQRDVVIQTSQGIRAVLSSPAGTLTDAALVAETDAAIDLQTGDVTGDGIADLVGIFAASSGVTIRVAIGAGDGTFAPFSMFAVPLDLRALQLADLDHDGKQDLVLTEYNSGGIWLARSTGGGAFETPHQLPGAREWAVVADINGDGNTDLITTDTQENLIYLGDAAGNLALSYSYDPDNPYSRPIAADFDGDGRTDILTTHRDASSGDTSITVMRGLASGSFGPPLVTSGLHFASLAMDDSTLVDVTGEGALDLVWLNRDLGLVVLPGYGDGYFYKQAAFFPAADGSAMTFAAHMQISDHDQDGRADILFWKGLGVGMAFNRGCVP